MHVGQGLTVHVQTADCVPVTGRHVDVVGTHVLTNQLRQVALIELYILIITDDTRPPQITLPSSGFDVVCITDRQEIHLRMRFKQSQRPRSDPLSEKLKTSHFYHC